MRVNHLFVFLNASVLTLACFAVPFGLAALPFSAFEYEFYSCVFAVLAFVLANVENRWRFPGWAAICFAGLVIALGIWLESLDHLANNTAGTSVGNTLPLVYFFLTVQALLVVKLTGPKTPADFWIEQGTGLVFVLFACLVSKSGAFSALLLLYIGTGVALLTLHHVRQWQAAEAVCRIHVSVRPVRAPTLEPAGRPRARGLLAWGLVVVPLVLLLFLFVPRPDFVWGDGGRRFLRRRHGPQPRGSR